MAKFFITRPVAAIVLAILMVIAGLIAGMGLPIAQYPQITLPTVRVAGFYPVPPPRWWSSPWPSRSRSRSTASRACST